MNVDRAKLEVDTLLKIVLVLIVILLALQVVQSLISGVASLLGPFFFIVQVAIAALIVLWLIDKL